MTFSPALAENVCPSTAAKAALTGKIVDYTVQQYGHEVYVRVNDQGNQMAQQGTTNIYEDGSFSFPIELGKPGVYWAQISLGDVHEDFGDLTVKIHECPVLGEMSFTPNDPVNECPATTAKTTFKGALDNWSDELVDNAFVDVAIYPVGGDKSVASDPVLTVADDGTFAFDIEGLTAGAYYAKVDLNVDGNVIETADVEGLTATIKPCEKPETGKPGDLPQTGALVLPLHLIGLGSVGGGIALKRRSMKN